MADGYKIDVTTIGAQDDGGTGDGELADPAFAKAAADDDTLYLGPGFQPCEPADDEGERLGEAFHRTQHQSGLGCVAVLQQGVQVLLLMLAVSPSSGSSPFRLR